MDIDLLQVPYDSGRRGYRMGAGPLRLVAAGLPGHLAARGHLVRLVPIELSAPAASEVAAAFALAGAVHAAATEARERGAFPLVLAGNCFTSLGVLAGLEQPRLFWFDAHGDLNTPETSPSGYFDGMALAVALGRCWTEERTRLGLEPLAETQVWLLGARALDLPERDYLARSAIRTTLEDLPARRQTLAAHLHLDLDVLDPGVARVNQFAAAGGFGVAQLLEAVERIARAFPLASATLSAYDPAADTGTAVDAAAFAVCERLAAVAV